MSVYNWYGERPGGGPRWACDDFGNRTHYAQDCPVCMDNFHSQIRNAQNLQQLSVSPPEPFSVQGMDWGWFAVAIICMMISIAMGGWCLIHIFLD